MFQKNTSTIRGKHTGWVGVANMLHSWLNRLAGRIEHQATDTNTREPLRQETRMRSGGNTGE